MTKDTQKFSPQTVAETVAEKLGPLNFDALLTALVQTNAHIAAQTSKAINMGLTLRNWLFGCYIHTYEQNGTDRAAYGEKLLEQLARHLQGRGISRTDERELRRYRQFYMAYPQIRDSLSPEFVPQLPGVSFRLPPA